MFDTIGTLVGTASKAGMLDKDGNMPKMKEALVADAVGTVTGAVTGTSTVTTFVESASGVEAGGRTGLTALTTAIMFISLFRTWRLQQTIMERFIWKKNTNLLCHLTATEAGSHHLQEQGF